ncbi:META domain-containing protein [Corynebacterium hylobatis]|nr:META domain-containing protein [Corynebacterium hylobatis]
MTKNLIRKIGAVAVALAFSFGGVATVTAAPGSAIVESVGFAGTWTADGPKTPRVTFNVDGTYGGNDGCNTMSGRYTVVDGRVHLGDAIKTKMYCGDDVWFEKADRLERDGDHLRVLDKEGRGIGTLKRDGDAPDPIRGLSSEILKF